jgi:3alpha(or 20beta)-hydroxysteroid dehydrogenase
MSLQHRHFGSTSNQQTWVMKRQLEEKTAIITGAASGIGAATARRFIAEGARVMLTDIQGSGAEIAAQSGGAAEFLRHDVTDETAWSQVVAATLSRFGRLDILVNNAGERGVKSMLETTAADLERSFRVNALGPMLGMQASFEALKASGKGAIVILSSGAAIRRRPGSFAYSASKWAVRGMSGCAAAELGPHGIRVNSIYPGLIQTPMLAANAPEALRQYEAMIPLGRIGNADEAAGLIAFLASDAASYLNGAEIVIDGGVML